MEIKIQIHRSGLTHSMESSGYVYESPDNGLTVYKREIGSTKRILVSQSPITVLNKRHLEWHKILEASQTCPALAEAVEKAETIYKLIK